MKLLNFPEYLQTYDYDCGAMAVESVLTYYGIALGEGKIIKLAGTTTKKGTPIQGILKVARKFGFKIQVRKMTLSEIKNFINQGIPVIIPLQAWTKKKKVNWQNNWSDGHYVVIIGYDQKKIYFEDPRTISRTYLTYNELVDRWHDVDSDGKRYINYGIVISGKKPKYNLNKAVHMD